MVLLGIMQGRLSPAIAGRVQCFPLGRWQQEFPRAAQAKLDLIEWIYDSFGAGENPIGTDHGVVEIRRAIDQEGVRVHSLCANWFMEFPLVRATPSEAKHRMDRLIWLLGRCSKIGIRRVVLPFLEGSEIVDHHDARAVVSTLTQVLPIAEKTGVELHLETALAPAPFAEILSQMPHPLIKVNYDSGNSTALEYDTREEFTAYGKRIGSVHIKDRLRRGATVPLGKGSVNFALLAECIKSVSFCGPFILEAARGPTGEEVQTAIRNREFVERLLIQPTIKGLT